MNLRRWVGLGTVVVLARRRLRHADLFEDSLRGGILGSHRGDDVIEVELVGSVPQHLPHRFRGIDNFEYVENFFVARAPNTEYWWIACSSDDDRCREAGRQWGESLDRQGAHINPQLRTRLEAARSY